MKAYKLFFSISVLTLLSCAEQPKEVKPVVVTPVTQQPTINDIPAPADKKPTINTLSTKNTKKAATIAPIKNDKHPKKNQSISPLSDTVIVPSISTINADETE